jgi:uncharacterized protein (DUF1501 family)
MNRRKFLRESMVLGGVPVLVGGLPISAFARFDMPFTSTDCAAIRERVLVIIQMEGGNDGLNTIIPKAQYSIYKNKRPLIAIPDTGANAFINLDGTLPVNNQVGLHPAMTAFKDLYDAGKLNVMHGVGYANNNRSHFKGTDLWLTAGDTNTPGLFDLTSGWMGRYLDYSYPGLINNPTPSMPDPLALELGATSGSLGFKTTTGQYANILLTTDAGSFSSSVAGLGGPPVNPFPASQMGSRLAYVRNIELSINAYSTRVTNTYNAGTNLATYPANSWLAYQLKTVARIIKGGSKTRVFMVHTSGYDTHNGQTELNSPTTGQHATILKDLADSVKAFQTDLQLMNLEDKVMTATFSEFARTLNENGSRGTDHGGVNSMFIIGKGVRPGVSGNPINLTNVVDDAVMDLQFDYRRVYTALLQDFMGAGNGALNATLLSNFQTTKPDIINNAAKADVSCYADIIVPVKLTDLRAVMENDGSVTVHWTTQQELNTSHFIVERSGSIGPYEDMGRVDGYGNSSVPRYYKLNDRTPLRGINIYRLKQVDKNGDFSYYGPVTIRVNNNATATISIMPNPATSFFNIVVNATKASRAQVQVYDMQGHLLMKQEYSVAVGGNTWRIPADRFAKGQVVVLVQTANGIKHSQQILIR